MLQRAGLTRSDVIWLRMDGSEVPERLRRGEIDAGGTWEPYISQSQKEGFHALFTSRESDLVLDAIAFHKSVLQEKKQAVQAFVDGWFDAVAYWQTHKAETTALLAKTLEIPASECLLDGIRLFSREDNRHSFSDVASGQGARSISRRFAEFCASQGNANVLVNAEEILDASFLQQ